MHPALILIPAAGLILGPRLWVRHVMNKHDAEDDNLPGTGSEVARTLLDEHQLQNVKVELTDLGDHYDPRARAVRLARDKFDRKSLSAVTTAAHEVAHAVQHASGYPPFEWRTRLATLARYTGLAGTVLLVSVPAASLVSRRPLPPALIGIGALVMLGTGVSAQLAALPTEFNASFERALPMLHETISEENLGNARQILVACSLTYVASSLAGVIHVWPWLGNGQIALVASGTDTRDFDENLTSHPSAFTAAPPRKRPSTRQGSLRGGTFEKVFRRTAKPLVRQWLRLANL